MGAIREMNALVNLNTLWIGEALHPIHQLCLLSALAQGHTVRLFSYTPIKNVPAGIETLSAEEVMPRSEMFFHAATGSPAPFADRFRIKLISLGFGAWTDTDMLFVRPLSGATMNIFGWENEKLIGNAILGFDIGHPAFRTLVDTISNNHFIPPWLGTPRRLYYSSLAKLGAPKHIKDMPYGTTGPDLLTWYVINNHLHNQAAPREVYYSLPYERKFDIFRSNSRYRNTGDLPKEAISVHLWFQGLVGGLRVTKESQTKTPPVESGSLLDGIARDLGMRTTAFAET